ncbi:DUF1972 domain-containing protein [Thiolapillus sp.]
MKIAILGTRGIPNHYGGFEQFAQYLALGLKQRGHEVTVYCSSNHPIKQPIWKGIQLKYFFDPENTIGTAGQFLYDFLSILDTRKENYDIIFQLGYTSSSIFFKLHPKKPYLVTNMDGLEWKRTKYNRWVQRFLLWAEKRAVLTSDYLVSDSKGISSYLQSSYKAESTYIPYGANLFNENNENTLKKLDVFPYQYNMLIARLEPENSIETILDGVATVADDRPFLVIGRKDGKFGKYLKKKFSCYSNIRFLGGIYDIDLLNNLRHYSNLYFHGHTVGGTNPSLLEAMASSALICASNNPFNSSILGEDSFYFESSKDVKRLLETAQKQNHQDKITNNRQKISSLYSWEKILDQYENLFLKIIKKQITE